MNINLKNDLDTLDHILENTKREALSFLLEIDKIPTSTTFNNHTERELEASGKGTISTLQEFQEKFREIIVASGGPRYWGFVTGGATPAAIVGDWLSSVYDQNTQAVKGAGDISGIIEFETLKLLRQLFNLPDDFLGGFVTGATISNFSCLAVARQWIGKEKGLDIAKEGLSVSIPVLAATPHSSAIKSLAMLGLGSNNLIKVATLPGNREAIDIADLETKIQELHRQPFILISSGGTVNTVDYDDMQAIAQLKVKHNFWWHVDAAFGAFAALSPIHRHWLAGWEQADSITIDCHKWLNVPYESAFFLVKEKHKLLQTETFQNSNAPYLGDPLENFNFLNFLPENSRRLKALPVWFTLLAYGREGYQDIVINNIQLAAHLGAYIKESELFELLAPVRLNTVCFTLAGDEKQGKVSLFLDTLNASGKVFMTPTMYQGKKGIRAALVNWRTTEADLQIAIEAMESAFNSI